jgi:hypothetical protein
MAAALGAARGAVSTENMFDYRILFDERLPPENVRVAEA